MEASTGGGGRNSRRNYAKDSSNQGSNSSAAPTPQERPQRNSHKPRQRQHQETVTPSYKIVVRDLPVRDFGMTQIQAAVSYFELQILPAYEVPPLPPTAATAIFGDKSDSGISSDFQQEDQSSSTISTEPARQKHPLEGTLLSVEHLIEGCISRTSGPIPGVCFLKINDHELFLQMAKCGYELQAQKHELASTGTNNAAISALSPPSNADGRFKNVKELMQNFLGCGDSLKARQMAQPEFEPALFHKNLREHEKADKLGNTYEKDSLYKGFILNMEKVEDKKTVPTSNAVEQLKDGASSDLGRRVVESAIARYLREQNLKKLKASKSKEGNEKARAKEKDGAKDKKKGKDRVKEKGKGKSEAKAKGKEPKDAEGSKRKAAKTSKKNAQESGSNPKQDQNATAESEKVKALKPSDDWRVRKQNFDSGDNSNSNTDAKEKGPSKQRTSDNQTKSSMDREDKQGIKERNKSSNRLRQDDARVDAGDAPPKPSLDAQKQKARDRPQPKQAKQPLAASIDDSSVRIPQSTNGEPSASRKPKHGRNNANAERNAEGSNTAASAQAPVKLMKRNPQQTQTSAN